MRLKPMYFVFALVILSFVCYFIGNRQLNKCSASIDNPFLIDISPNNISDSILEKTCIVFFYIPNSEICKNMECKLNQLAQTKGKAIPFYAVNVDFETAVAYKYNISGPPSILLFKNGKEYKRIMGVVSAYNLSMIYERDIK